MPLRGGSGFAFRPTFVIVRVKIPADEQIAMSQPGPRFGYGFALYIVTTCVLGLYFAFASIQGDYGLLRRIQIDAEVAGLEHDLAMLRAEVADYRNKTHRLSDAYLDLDLLDEQARDILGFVRADEVVFR